MSCACVNERVDVGVTVCVNVGVSVVCELCRCVDLGVTVSINVSVCVVGGWGVRMWCVEGCVSVDVDVTVSVNMGVVCGWVCMCVCVCVECGCVSGGVERVT